MNRAVCVVGAARNPSTSSGVRFARCHAAGKNMQAVGQYAGKTLWRSSYEPRGTVFLASVNREKGIIRAFGLGFAPRKAPNPAQREMMARKAAMADAQAWVARIADWSEKDIKCAFDVSRTVVGVETLKEFWVDNTIYVVKVRAPVDCES